MRSPHRPGIERENLHWSSLAQHFNVSASPTHAVARLLRAVSIHETMIFAIIGS
jgi:hypothetical protein